MDPPSAIKSNVTHTDTDLLPHYPGSSLTLRFEDRKLEEAYRARRQAAHVLGWRIHFGLVFYLVLLVEAVAAAGRYGDTRENLALLYTQLVVLGILAVIGAVALAVAAVVSLYNKKLIQAGLLVISAVGLSIVDERFAVRIADGDYSGGMTSSFLPMLILTVCSIDAMDSHFITFLASVVVCSVVQLSFQLGGVRISSGVLECVFYFLVGAWLSSLVYNNERHTREAFCLERTEYTCVISEMELENWGPPEEILNTEFELILTDLHVAYQLISEVWTVSMPKDTRMKLKESLKRIFQAGKVLKSGSNIHAPLIGVVSKQLDTEYRHYLEQNYLTPHVQDRQKGSKKPEDHQFKYAQKDLLPMLGQLEKNWNFDMFFLAQVSGFRPVEVTGAYCIKKYSLDAHLNLSEARCLQFFQQVETVVTRQKYKPNPYHNSTHAADVLNSILFLYKHSQIFENMTELELLGSIIAALGHDVGHPAFNNRYLINTKSSFALICKWHADNDLSILENMHSALTFELLEQTNLLGNFSTEDWFKIRKVITDMILATDMMKHFDLVGTFRVKYADKSFPLREFEDRVGVYRLCIKCADVAHAAKAVDLHEKWSLNVVEEFFHQGDLEREQKLEISAYCDRYQSDVPSSQCGFIMNIVRPMYEALNTLLKSREIATVCIEQFETNISFWANRTRSKKRPQTVKEPLLVPREEGEPVVLKDQRKPGVRSSSGDIPEAEDSSQF